MKNIKKYFVTDRTMSGIWYKINFFQNFGRILKDFSNINVLRFTQVYRGLENVAFPVYNVKLNNFIMQKLFPFLILPF